MVSDFLKELQSNYDKADVEFEFINADIALYDKLSESETSAKFPEFDEFYEKLTKIKMRVFHLRINVPSSKLNASELYAIHNNIVKYYNEPNLIKVDSTELCSYIIQLKTVFETLTNIFLSKLSTFSDQMISDNKAIFNTSAKKYKRNFDNYMIYDEPAREAYEASLKVGQSLNNSILTSALSRVDTRLISAHDLLHDETQLRNAKKHIFAQVYLTDIYCKLSIAKTQSDYNLAVYDAIYTDIAIDLDAHNALFNKSIHYKPNIGSLHAGSPSLTNQKQLNDLNITDTNASFNQTKKMCAKQLKEAQNFTDKYLNKTCINLLEDSSNDYETQLSILGYAIDDNISKLLKEQTKSNGWTVYSKNGGREDMLPMICDLLNAHVLSVHKMSDHEFATGGEFVPSDVFRKLNEIYNIGSSTDNNFNKIVLELFAFAFKIRFILLTFENGLTIDNCAENSNFKLNNFGLDDDDALIDKYKDMTQFIIVLKFVDVNTQQIRYVIPHHISVANAILDVNDISEVGLLPLFKNTCINTKDEVYVLQTALNKFSIRKETNEIATATATDEEKMGLNGQPQIGGAQPTVIPTVIPTVAPPQQSPSIKSKDKRIQKDLHKNDKLSYYVMIDLMLSPGDKMNPLEKMSMACSTKMDDINKSLSETFGYAYAPPPLFTDYDVSRHDKDSSKFSNLTQFETPYNAQREREINALMTDNYKKDQDLMLHKNMLNNAQTNRRPFGLF